MKLPLKTRVFLYLLTTKASFFLSPCKHPIHQKYLDIIETGNEKKEEDFDLYNIIKESRDLKYEMEVLKEKMGMLGDPVFFQTDPANLI